MTNTYSVLGMTCNGCKNSVTQKLNAIKGVLSTTVDLVSATATVALEHPIDIRVLQEALPEKFSISEINTAQLSSEIAADSSSVSNEETLSKLQQLKPLFLIFGFIVVLVTAKNSGAWSLDEVMLDFMGAFFLIFSLFKFFDLKGFATSFVMYDPLAKAIPAYGLMYPFIEVTLGVLFLARIEIPIALIATIVFLTLTTLGVTKCLLSKETIQCACLGTVLKLPMTLATFIENSIMIVMAIVLIFKSNLL